MYMGAHLGDENWHGTYTLISTAHISGLASHNMHNHRVQNTTPGPASHNMQNTTPELTHNIRGLASHNIQNTTPGPSKSSGSFPKWLYWVFSPTMTRPD